MKTKLGEVTNKNSEEQSNSQQLLNIKLDITPSMGSHWNLHSNTFIDRIALSRILYFDKIYQDIINIPGVICEFGVQWGASLVTLMNLRGIHEPYNYSRKIIGFDTFSGFSHVDEQDGGRVSIGDYRTVENYQEQLEEILRIHEANSPIGHINKFELVKGDVSITCEQWLDNNPHAIISLAIFDMDVYKPTKDVLEKIIPRLVKGSLVVFDELNCPDFPGETAAVQEVLGLNNIALKRDPNQPYCAWFVWGE